MERFLNTKWRFALYILLTNSKKDRENEGQKDIKPA